MPSVQVAISQILDYIQDDDCNKLVAALANRVSWGIYIATNTYGRNGLWVGNEPGGTIYLNRQPDYMWDSNGNVIYAGQGNEPLRNALIEEMIHMWFDTDVGHASSDPPEKHAAMDAMRHACGKYNY